MDEPTELAYYYAMRDRFEINDFDTYARLLRNIATTPPKSIRTKKMYCEQYLLHYRSALASGLLKLATDIAFAVSEIGALENKRINSELKNLAAIAPLCDQMYLKSIIKE
jgi:hypothetical protein